MRNFLLGVPVDGAFNIPFKVEKTDPEEAVYKELLINLMADTLPTTAVFPSDISAYGRAFAIVSSKVTDLTIEFSPTAWNITTAAQNFVYGCTNLSVLRLPNTTILGYPSITQGGLPKLTDIYIPKVRQFMDANNTWYNLTMTHLNVHMGELTCDEIMAVPRFPGTNNNAFKAKITFVGSDGSLNWDGTAWVKS